MPIPLRRLTAAQARRIAVAARGFGEQRPVGRIDRAHIRRLISRIQVLQLDSVSVVVRAHYAPVFSRLGRYDRDVLDRAAWDHSVRSPRLLVEYWAHEAALIAVDDWPLMRWRMREYRHGRWGTHIVKANPDWPTTASPRSRNSGRLPLDRSKRTSPRSHAAPKALVEPQRHRMGCGSALRRRCADHGHPRRLRPPLRPDRAGAAARGRGAKGRRR